MFLPELKNLITSNSKDITNIKLSEVLSLSLENNITPLHTLKGHSDLVISVSWSPDGKFVASVSFDKTIKIWDVKKGTLVHTLKGHSDLVISVSWSPDGKFVASGSLDNTAIIWDAKKGTLVHTLKGHSSGVESVSWSPDGEFLASGSSDKTVRIWDTKRGRLVRTLKGHSDLVWSVSWSPGGKFVASGGWDQTVRIWNVKSGTLVHTLKGHSNWIKSVSWSPGGEFVASSGSFDATVRIWDVKKGTLVHTLKGHSDSVRSVSWSPGGEFVASSGSFDATIKIWDAKSGTVVHILKGHSNWVNSVSWSPDGKFLASGSLDATIKIWDVKKGTLVHTLKGHSDSVRSVSWSPNGKFVATGSKDKTVKIWRIFRKLNSQDIQQVLDDLKMNSSVRALNLSDLQLHSNNILTLCNLLNVNKYITSIDLSNVNIEEKGILALAKCLVNNKSLLYLNLTNAAINNKGAQYLCKGLEKNQTLKNLIVEKNKISLNIKEQMNNFVLRNKNLALESNILDSEIGIGLRRKPKQPEQSKQLISKPEIGDDLVFGTSSSYLISSGKLKYEESDLLGSGGCGAVYKGFWEYTKVAIKVLFLKKMAKDTMAAFKSEARIMTKLHHPNTLPLFGICIEPGKYAMIMPYMKHGSLFAYLHNSEPLPWKKRWKMAFEIANGLLHLHSKNILHRDLKSLNVLLDKSMQARLCDFGISKVKRETMTTTLSKTPQAVGTVPWMSPELFEPETKYTKACDVYSFGMILWEITTRKPPWTKAQDKSIIINWVSRGYREKIPDACPPIFKEIITNCWKDAKQRPTMKEVVKILHDNKQEALRF